MGDVVKKQHYIWRKYLTRWTDSGDRANGKLYVLRKKIQGQQERIEFSKLEKIGFEKYYYDVTGFQEKDISILKEFLSYIQKNEKVKMELPVNIFSEATEKRDFIEKRVMCSYENIDNECNFLDKLSKGDCSFYRDSKSQIILNKIREAKSQIVLFGESNLAVAELINIVNEFLQEGSEERDLKYEFHRFFWMQYFRSPRIHSNLTDIFNEMKEEKDELKDLNTNFYVNMVAIYCAERMAINITQNFKTSIWLYDNKTDVSFITGDTPIVNLSGDEMNEMTIFHYPISPRVAVQLIVNNKVDNVSNEIPNEHVLLEQEQVALVRDWNQKLADNCVNEIYSNDNRYFTEIKYM